MHIIKLSILLALWMLASACTGNKFEEAIHENSLDITFDSFFNLKSVSRDPLIIIGENAEKKLIIKFNIKSLKNKKPEEEIKRTLIRLLSQYQFSMAPYPGQLTTAIKCGSKYHPQIRELSKISSIVSFTNERLAVSVCDEEVHSYQQTTVFLIDALKKRLIIVDIYQHKELEEFTSQKLLSKYFINSDIVDLSEFNQLFKKI